MPARSAHNPYHPLVWLHETVIPRSLVGGKGAGLSELAALGAPVPPAFAITTHAWRDLATSLGLPRHAGDAGPRDLPEIQSTIMTAPLPNRVAMAIREGYEAFCTMLGAEISLAVRSSATAEDSTSCSFAGLHDTVLDVRTAEGLETAIRQCWASLWSERAHVYRMANSLATGVAETAVVVQQLIRSDVSFVAFTADPVHHRTDRLVITATWGLGEAIVSGLVIPDQIVVGPDGAIVEHAIGGKHMMVIPGSGPDTGTRQVPVPRLLQSQPALSQDQVTAITTTARSLSARLGYEADLEGGFTNGQLYLFQARPITTKTSSEAALGHATTPEYTPPTTSVPIASMTPVS